MFQRSSKLSSKSSAKSSRSQKTKHTHTPARQRAITRKSYIVAVVGFVLVILALAQFGEDGLATFLKLRSHENELVLDVQKLEKKNAEMQEKLVGLATDPAILEEIAREEHNMQLPHEEVLTVIPEKGNKGNDN